MPLSNMTAMSATALWVMILWPVAAMAGNPLCPEDFTGDDKVDAADLAELLLGWGSCLDPCAPGDPASTCGADFTGDCEVNAADLADLLVAWGECDILNDDCETRIEIFDGDTSVDIAFATTGGPVDPGCPFQGGLPRLDLWYEYTATCSGTLCITTCIPPPLFDTTLSIYQGCDCPAASDQLVSCSDDATFCANGASTAATPVSPGECLKIRLGSYFEEDLPGTTGTMSVSCLEGVTSNCCSGHDQPGCDDQACQDLICDFFDPFCCNKVFGSWDSTCVDWAHLSCPTCDGGC